MASGLVGAVLMLAGVAKIAGSRPGSGGAGWTATGPALSAGLPGWILGPLPYVELVVGALVLSGVRPAGVAAALLLAAFSGRLILLLVRGDRRPCGCFGETTGRPVSGWTLTRNAVLIAAAVVVAAGADGPAGWAGRLLGAALAAILVLGESRVGVAK